MHSASRPPSPDAYVGRFAPSPTGPLHFGSLVAAVGSCLEARRHGGRWLLRIEDVDAPRTVPGAAGEILRQLDACGLEWDGKVIWQSERLHLYRAALDTLIASGAAYPCACSRREIADSTLARDGSRRYPGTCRGGLAPGRTPRAWRVRTDDAAIVWHDAVQGRQEENVLRDVGDFVLLRADGQYAYQLAVVMDDGLQGVSHVVRGADLLDSTGRQIHLQRLLGHPQPEYAHLPVATNAAGEKLSKQTRAAPVEVTQASAAISAALAFLGQRPPADLGAAPLGEVWQWARENWQLERVPQRRGVVVSP